MIQYIRSLIFCILLVVVIISFSGCAYWPRTLTPKYVHESIKDVKNDIDDTFGARNID